MQLSEFGLWGSDGGQTVRCQSGRRSGMRFGRQRRTERVGAMDVADGMRRVPIDMRLNIWIVLHRISNFSDRFRRSLLGGLSLSPEI
jgi:hypothetical protein